MINSKSKLKGSKIKRKGIWQLFRATDFESLMYPCITFCRILGIFPYKIDASIVKTCKPSYILSIIIICSFCTFDLITLYEVNVSKTMIFKDMGAPRVLERNCFYFVGGFIAVSTFILSGPQMRFFQMLIELSLKLPSKSYQNASKLIHAKDIFGTLFLIVQMTLYYVTGHHVSFIRKFTVIYIFLIEFQVNMLYMNCVCILKACFKQINDNLANLRELVKNGEPYLLNGIYQEQRIPCLLMEITALKKQHLAVSEAVQMLNTIFSLQLLATIIMTFIEITFNLYFYLIKQLISEDTSMDNLEKAISYMNFIVGPTYSFIKIVLVIWACETGKNQAMEIINTVHSVFNSTSNKQIKYELQLFSLQLLHHKNDIFSVKVINIDSELLAEIVGGITMYILILIQFLLTSCDGKSVQFTDII